MDSFLYDSILSGSRPRGCQFELSSTGRAPNGSFEVRFSDGRPSVYFYWDDIPGAQMLSHEQMDSNRALEAARALARSERDKIK